MKSTILSLMILGAGTALAMQLPVTSAEAFSFGSKESVKKTGTVQRYLLNPEGDVDGFLLTDGTQVKFPPHLSTTLTAAVAPKDKVEVSGNSESDKSFQAEKITNTSNGKSVTHTPPNRDAGGPGGPGAPPPPPPGGPKGPRERRAGLQEMSAQGKVLTQLFGPKGDVNGVILGDANESIVRFPPHLAQDANTKIDVGQSLKVSGFGTKNAYGQAIEATQLSNN